MRQLLARTRWILVGIFGGVIAWWCLTARPSNNDDIWEDGLW